MNYAKHFSGEAEAGSNATHYYLNKNGTASSTSSPGNASIVKEQIIGGMIESTLKDCGLSNCKYYGTVDNKPVSYLCLDDTEDGKPGFYIFYNGTYMYFMLGYCVDSSDTYIKCSALPTSGPSAAGDKVRFTSSSTNMFSTATLVANLYNTYIKVVGDTASGFTLYFSNYNTTTFTQIMSISRMIDKRNNKELFGYHFYSVDFGTVTPIYNDANLAVAYTSNVPNTFTAYVSNGYTLYDNYIILINKFCSGAIHLWFVDGYIPPSTFTNGNFYEIDGDVYYKQSYGLFKCTTSVSQNSG